MRGHVVAFGAGATGRGHVGLLAYEAGYPLVLVDKDPALIARLREAGRYRVRLYGGGSAGEACREVVVEGFRAYHSEERQAVARELVGAALVLTAVFDRNLADVAATVAMGIEACREAGREAPMNVLACENMMDSSSTLGAYVGDRLGPHGLAYCEGRIGFPDCMISRVVPQPEPDPLGVVTEDYNEWTARRDAWVGPALPGLTALELVENQEARLERKLFIHNGGHAVCGYLAFHRGHRYIHEAVADPVVAAHVRGALDELGEVVRRRHGFPEEEIEAYKADLVRRGSIAMLRDEVLRVVRDPVRKLSPRERLVAPALLAVDYGLPRRWIVRGIVAALRTLTGVCNDRHQGDDQSVALGGKLRSEGLDAVLAEVCGLPPGSPLYGEIGEAWDAWPGRGFPGAS